MNAIPCPICGDILPVGSFCAKDGSRIAPPFGTGTLVGTYRVEAKIGQGGMGEVWRARHIERREFVAIKTFNPDLLSNATLVTRFEREFKAINAVRHKNLVEVLGFGQLSTGTPYFIMEFLQGKTLRQRLREPVPLSYAEIAQILEQVCAGLNAAHQKEIIHRDLKPDNIFLCQQPGSDTPRVKLLDFGIAKLAETDEPGHTLTKTGSVFGTPSYMSPEQCAGAKNVDVRSDVYSLGILLFEMIAGRPPFTDENDGSGMIIAKQITAPVPNLSQFTTQKVSSALESFVKKVLAKSPAERPATAIAFADQLNSLLEEEQQTHTISRQITNIITLPNAVTLTLNNPAPVAPSVASSTTLSLANTVKPVKPAKSNNLSLWIGAFSFLVLGPLLYFLFSPSPQPKVLLSISTTPNGAKLTLNGELLGLSPVERELPAQGQIVILEAALDGYYPITQTISLTTSTKIPNLSLTPIPVPTQPQTQMTQPTSTSAPKTCPDIKCPSGQSCIKGSCVVNKCNEKTCAGSCIKDICVTVSKEEMLEDMKVTLASPDGCSSGVKKMNEFHAIFGPNPDIYFFRAYCARDRDVNKACANYVTFLKTAKGDPRANAAKSFISAQDSAKYKSCVLP